MCFKAQRVNEVDGVVFDIPVPVKIPREEFNRVLTQKPRRIGVVVTCPEVVEVGGVVLPPRVGIRVIGLDTLVMIENLPVGIIVNERFDDFTFFVGKCDDAALMIPVVPIGPLKSQLCDKAFILT